MDSPVKPPLIRAPRGTTLQAKSWLTEAPLRMLMNNLDPEVAEKPEDLIVYGGIGRAARNWDCYHRIVETLKTLEADETLLVQSGKPVGVVTPLRTPSAWPARGHDVEIPAPRHAHGRPAASAALSALDYNEELLDIPAFLRAQAD